MKAVTACICGLVLFVLGVVTARAGVYQDIERGCHEQGVYLLQLPENNGTGGVAIVCAVVRGKE